MAGNGAERQVQQVADAVTGLLAEAVKETIEQRSPEPARECIAQLRAVDNEAAPDDSGGPAQLMATLSLVRWGSLARRALDPREASADERPDGAPEPDPEWVERSLAWVQEALGTRFRARSRYTSGALRSEEEAAEIMLYMGALRDDFLPSLVWLMSGTVAVYGAGDIGWLRELEQNAPAGI